MQKLGMISPDQFQELMGEEIGFEQGQMFFRLNTLMDLVKAGLSLPEVEEALAAHGIDNVATSGIKIYTTVDKALQDTAFYNLRKELSRLSTRLKGYVHKEVQQHYADLTEARNRNLYAGAFLFGTISSIDISDRPLITVSLGNFRGRKNLTGIIDRSGLQQILDSHVKWKKQRWAEPEEQDMQRFLKGFKVGDRVFVSVENIDQDKDSLQLTLEKYPKIQGALLVLKDGSIQAMVGGMENHYFNRAISAKRPMGSVVKPLVYTAAMQLGWNSIDALDNERNLFVYQKQAYFPRPDHDSPHKQVSMNWAGVHSENVATVWLLYHLCDHLTPAQFKELISHLDLSRREYETQVNYRQRLRDTLGIVVDEEQLYRAAFRQAVINLEPDLIFSGYFAENQYLKKMQYGAGFELFLEDVENLAGPEYESEEQRRRRIEAEQNIRLSILKNNYIDHIKLLGEVEYLRAEISGELELTSPEMPETLLGNFYHDPFTNRFIYASEPLENTPWQLLSPADIKKELTPLPFRWLRRNFQEDFWDNLLIEGKVSVATMQTLKDTVEAEFGRLSALPPYSFEVLSLMPDFRVLAGLRYVTALGRALNIRSELEPVLSFPLGSNVISLLETAMTYQGMTMGHITVNGSDDGFDALAIIDRIENTEGEIIYTPQRRNIRIVDARTSLNVSEILKNVVKFGTGQSARAKVRLHSHDPEVEEQLKHFDLPLPVIGKTGTANRFTNSAFAGVIPGPISKQNGFATKNGYTVAAYVGFDNNDPMVRKTTHITGSSGALPVWTRMVNSIILEKDFGAKLDLVDLAFSADPLTGKTGLRLIHPDLGQLNIPVHSGNGLPVTSQYNSSNAESSRSVTVMAFGTLLPSGEIVPARIFKPFWDN